VVSLYAETPGGLEASLRAAGVQLYHLDKRRGMDLRMYPRMARALRDFRPDILHTHNYVLRYTYPVAVALRVPRMVHTIHNVADREVDRTGLWLQKFAFRMGVKAVTIADEVSASFHRVYGFEEAALIPNGIPVRRYSGTVDCASRVARAQRRGGGRIRLPLGGALLAAKRSSHSAGGLRQRARTQAVARACCWRAKVRCGKQPRNSRTSWELRPR
jgi:hypothetical protein